MLSRLIQRAVYKPASAACLWLLPVSGFVLIFSVVLSWLLLRAIAAGRASWANVLYIPWALYGILATATSNGTPAPKFQSHSACAALVCCVLQCAVWIAEIASRLYSFCSSTPDEQALLFDSTIFHALGGKLQHRLGLVWDPVGGWLIVGYLSVIACGKILYVAEMYRSLYIHILSGFTGWRRIEACYVDNPPPRQTTRNKKTEPGTLQKPDEGKPICSDYLEKLNDYYAHYGELGQMASVSGLPVEKYIEGLTEGRRKYWEAYLRNIEEEGLVS